jgi:hypothetical protein
MNPHAPQETDAREAAAEASAALTETHPDAPPPLPRRKRRRPIPRAVRYPELSEEQILAWADAHYARTGKWPGGQSGRVFDAPREKWPNLEAALRNGCRGLPGHSSLAQLLAERRGVRNRMALPPLAEEQILTWADAHHARTGAWPRIDSGPIVDAPGETWLAAHTALVEGCRGMPGGSSLPRLLDRHRGVRNIHGLPPLTGEEILAWADAHYRRHGKWPRPDSGPIEDAPGETWKAVDGALKVGNRGLPRGSSLFRVLAEQRGAHSHNGLPLLTEDQILAWADAHYAGTGRWPSANSSVIEETPYHQTWKAIDMDLRKGSRGLPGGTTLARLLGAHRRASGNMKGDRRIGDGIKGER